MGIPGPIEQSPDLMPRLTKQDRRVLAALPGFSERRGDGAPVGLRDRDVVHAMGRHTIPTAEVTTTLHGLECFGFARRWTNRHEQELWTRTILGDNEL